MAERSKAVDSSDKLDQDFTWEMIMLDSQPLFHSRKRRGFESHSCQPFFFLLLLFSPLVDLLFVLLENSVASRIQTLISTAVFRCKYPICSTQSRVPRGSGMGMLSHPARDQTGVPQTTPFLFILSPSPKRQPQLASRDGPVAAGFARQTPPVGFD